MSDYFDSVAITNLRDFSSNNGYRILYLCDIKFVSFMFQITNILFNKQVISLHLLSSEATQCQNSLVLLDNSIQLYINSIKDKESLLEIAKVGYKSEQMTMEDYLKYEDD